MGRPSPFVHPPQSPGEGLSLLGADKCRRGLHGLACLVLGGQDGLRAPAQAQAGSGQASLHEEPEPAAAVQGRARIPPASLNRQGPREQ